MTRISISITDEKAVERLKWLSDRMELSFAAIVGQALKQMVEHEQKVDKEAAEWYVGSRPKEKKKL